MYYFIKLFFYILIKEFKELADLEILSLKDLKEKINELSIFAL